MSARSDSTKQKIFDTMVDLIGKQGYQGVSVDEVAAEAGVAKGTLYYHYKSKADMMIALLEDRARPLIELETTIKEQAQDNAEQALRDLLSKEFTYFYEQRSFARVLLTELWREDREWQENVRQLRNRIVGLYTYVLYAGIEQGRFRTDLPVEYGASAIFGLCATTVLDRLVFEPSASPETAQEHLLQTVLKVVSRVN